MNFWYRFWWSLAYIPIRVGFPTKFVGDKDLLNKSGKSLIACNHMSYADILVIKSHIRQKNYVLAKHTLFKNKIFGKLLKTLGAIPVNRENVGTSTIRAGLDILKNDKQLIIFPEGTRRMSIDDIEAVKSGTAMFALKTNTAVTPIALLYKPRLFRPNIVLIGEPIDVSQYQDQKMTKEILAELGDKILGSIKELRNNYVMQYSPKKQYKLYKKMS